MMDIDQEKGISIEKEIRGVGGKALFTKGNVTDPDDCSQAVERTLSEFGDISHLVNNAGIIRRANILDATEDEWDQSMAVNVKSVFLLSRKIIPIMERRGGGTIVNISSGWGLVGGKRAALYCASKGAVVQLTRAMAIDHGPINIRVNCICPGDTETPMLLSEADQLGKPLAPFLAEAAERPLGRIGQPEDIANAALFLASESASYITGSVLVVDGGGLAG
jgi:NAD(P)-dependent dehydrogenase (short-subunit alcohol dehydrogenase family)